MYSFSPGEEEECGILLVNNNAESSLTRGQNIVIKGS